MSDNDRQAGIFMGKKHFQGGSYGLVRNDVDWVMSGRGFDSEPPHISQDILCSQEVFYTVGQLSIQGLLNSLGWS